MELDILKRLTLINRPLKMPQPVDGRKSLAVNRDGRKWKIRKVKELKGMVWHQELGWGSVEAVARYHTSKTSHLCKGGAESIAYSFAIRRNGQIVLCNDLKKATWSQGYKGRKGDENAEFLSVMFEGMFHGVHVTDSSAGEPNDKQIIAALTLWQVAKELWGWEENDLYGHYHMGKPACPGDTLQKVIDSIRVNYTEEKPTTYNFSLVKDRQQALIDLGFLKGNADGIWGPMSKGALIKCQSKLGLVADGVWGPKTASAINKSLQT